MKRRTEMLAQAEEAGIPLEQAEYIVEIALEEGLDPELAIELVRRGLHHRLVAREVSGESDQPAADRYLPEWMFPPEPAGKARWERALRISFRRLRSQLEEHGEIGEAFVALEREVDPE